MRKLTTEEFIEKAKLVHGDKYDYSKVEYVRNNVDAIITCPIHGKFKVYAESHLRSKCGCQKCGNGRHTFSATQLYNFIKGSFPDSIREKSIGRLRLDIFIPSLSVAIEYQGLQHFKPINFYGGDNSFKLQQERDKRKYNSCKELGIKLFYFTDDKKCDDLFLNEKVYKDREQLLHEIKRLAKIANL